MTENLHHILDCRGQACPRPILETARAARKLGSTGGELTILSDDEAFPLDVESWCRTSGAELVDFLENDDGYRALVRVAPSTGERRSLASRTMKSTPPVAQEEIQQIDARGLECPRPILAVARAARNPTATKLEVLADDDAFAMDIRSWARTTGSTIETLEQTGNAYRALIRLPESDEAKPQSALTRSSPPPSGSANGTLDLSRTALRSVREALVGAVDGLEALSVIAPDPSYTSEIVSWCVENGHQIVSLNGAGPVLAELSLHAGVARSAPPATPAEPVSASTAMATLTSAALAPRPAAFPEKQNRSATFLVLHNDKESLLAALMCANGAAAQGMDVMLYFTFFGLNLLRGDKPNPAHKKEKVTWAQRLFKWLMPKGPEKQTLSKLSFGGMGDFMMGGLMRDKNLMELPELMSAAQEQGCRLVACTTAMSVMGITKRDLHPYDGLEYGGVAAFVEAASNSEMSLVF